MPNFAGHENLWTEKNEDKSEHRAHSNLLNPTETFGKKEKQNKAKQNKTNL